MRALKTTWRGSDAMWVLVATFDPGHARVAKGVGERRFEFQRLPLLQRIKVLDEFRQQMRAKPPDRAAGLVAELMLIEPPVWVARRLPDVQPPALREDRIMQEYDIDGVFLPDLRRQWQRATCLPPGAPLPSRGAGSVALASDGHRHGSREIQDQCASGLSSATPGLMFAGRVRKRAVPRLAISRGAGRYHDVMYRDLERGGLKKWPKDLRSSFPERVIGVAQS
jgi:hypothetical protein